MKNTTIFEYFRFAVDPPVFPKNSARVIPIYCVMRINTQLAEKFLILLVFSTNFFFGEGISKSEKALMSVFSGSDS